MLDNPLGFFHINLFDSTVRTSILPSDEPMANMVPRGDRAMQLVTESLHGDSVIFKSHNRIVVSSDADARSDPSGENCTAQTGFACPWNSWVFSLVCTFHTAQEVPVMR